ncbi:hornerin isoform X1 [Pungitius pungitius]|uniref:hornerin isoform X1 n=2 Tax=Pungitius pungitius TaxID=134920 RepID=UPI002E0E4D98
MRAGRFWSRRGRSSDLMGEAQSRSAMLHHQDQPLDSAYGGKGGSSNGSSSSLRNKDGNFNFLSGQDDEGTGGGGGDENQNPVRPRNLGPLGRDPPNSKSPSGYHHNSGVLSPRSRRPCWSRLEPLPEIECGDDGCGRVPPDGAEEGRVQEEQRKGMKGHAGERQRGKTGMQERKGSRGSEEEEEVALEDGDEWGDSDSESDFSNRSGGSMSSLNMDSGGEGMLMGGWDRIGVGEPKSSPQECDPTKNGNREPPGRRGSFGRRSLTGSHLGNVLEEGPEEEGGDRSSDSDSEMPELMDAVWTLRDRERFKAQEMEKHQVQLTMYRRLALIRWVRTLQVRIQEQQNRLQSSFDVILTQRKELLRMGAAAAVANVPPLAAVSHS